MKKLLLIVFGILLCLPALAVAVISFYVRGGDQMGKWLVEKVKEKSKLTPDA